MKRCAPLPLGVSGATTWLNLMMMGACAWLIAGAAKAKVAAMASAARRLMRVMVRVS